MSPFLFDADLASTTVLASRRRESTSVVDASDAYVAQLFGEYRDAVAAGNRELMALIRDHAYAIDPLLPSELDGFDYPAAA